ncbi:MAG: ATP-binding protein [Candidatus Paracaedibacteraceae bacterium]|nr:ATP-binding protein [Candidatus Paracaedibacteraceae bacterium]
MYSSSVFFRPFQLLKRFLPQNLFGRTLIILLVPVILLQIILGYIFFERHTETILRTLSETIAGDIALVMAWHETPETPFEQLKILAKEYLSLELELDEQSTLDRTGQYRENWLYIPLTTALDAKIKAPHYVRMTPEHIYISVQTKKGLLHASLLRKRLFSRTTPLVLIWTTVSAMLLFGVASIFMRNQIRPIRRLAEAAEKFGIGDELVPFKAEGALEVRKAGYAFIRMRERLKRLLHERIEMLAGVSHDLRTPITRLKLSVVMMPECAQKQQIEADTHMLHQMVEGFLSFARGTTEEEKQSVKLLPWIHEITKHHRLESLLISGNYEIETQIKKSFFNRCLTNLVVNSEKYARNLSIDVRRVGSNIVIIFDDDGPGIPECERDNVFKPFYRLDQARNLDTVGVGLGLSIARDVVLTHGGQIDLMMSPMKGLRVQIRLPLDL